MRRALREGSTLSVTAASGDDSSPSGGAKHVSPLGRGAPVRTEGELPRRGKRGWPGPLGRRDRSPSRFAIAPFFKKGPRCLPQPRSGARGIAARRCQRQKKAGRNLRSRAIGGPSREQAREWHCGKANKGGPLAVEGVLRQLPQSRRLRETHRDSPLMEGACPLSHRLKRRRQPSALVAITDCSQLWLQTCPRHVC